MATKKVGVYRKYHGKIPTDKNGKPLPRADWAKKRPCRWAVRWFGSDGKRYSKSFRTRKEAGNYAKFLQSEVDRGKADPPQKITLSVFICEHEGIMKGQVAPKTLKDHIRALRLFANEIDGETRLDCIHSRNAELFVSHRLEQEKAVATVNKDIRTLKGIFNLAIEPRGYLAEGTNPFAKIKTRRCSPKPPQYVPVEDFQQIFAANELIWWKALLVVAYTSGTRENELLNLTWADIDFQESQLRIARKDKSEWIQPWQPKDYEMRTIPIPGLTIDLLAAWQSVAPENCPYIFMEHGRWEYYKERVKQGKWRAGQSLVNNVLRRFQTLCRKAVVESYTIQDLRRSCITNWAKRLPVHVVQKLAGHSDIRTTQKYYLSVQTDDIRKARRVQAKLLEKIPVNNLTDPKVTHSAQKRTFPGKPAFRTDS